MKFLSDILAKLKEWIKNWRSQRTLHIHVYQKPFKDKEGD